MKGVMKLNALLKERFIAQPTAHDDLNRPLRLNPNAQPPVTFARAAPAPGELAMESPHGRLTITASSPAPEPSAALATRPRGQCPTCAGPAYVGLERVECINPDCAPFDPRAIPRVVAIKVPAGAITSDDLVPEWALEQQGPAPREDMWAVQRSGSSGFECVAPTRDACIDAWLAKHADRVRSEPARRAVNAMSRRATKEQQLAATFAYTGQHGPIAFHVDDWTRLAWCCWEAMQ